MDSESRVEVVQPTQAESTGSSDPQDAVEMLKAFVHGSESNAHTKAESYLTTILQREIGLIQQSIGQLLTLQQTDSSRREDFTSRWFEIRTDVHRLSDAIHSIERSVNENDNTPAVIKTLIHEEFENQGALVARGLTAIEALVRRSHEDILRSENETGRRQDTEFNVVRSQLGQIDSSMDLSAVEGLIRSQGNQLSEFNDLQRKAIISEFQQMREQLRQLGSALDDINSLDSLVRSQGEELIRLIIEGSQRSSSQLSNVQSQLRSLEATVKEIPVERLLTESREALINSLTESAARAGEHYSHLQQSLSTLQSVCSDVVSSQGRYYEQAYHATKARLDQMERRSSTGFQGVVLKLEQIAREHSSELSRAGSTISDFSQALISIRHGVEELKSEVLENAGENQTQIANAFAAIESVVNKNTTPLLQELSAVARTLSQNQERFERQTAQAFATLSALVTEKDELAKARDELILQRFAAVEPQLNWMSDINTKMVKAVNQIASKLNFVSASNDKKEKRNLLIAGAVSSLITFLLMLNLMVSYYFR